MCLGLVWVRVGAIFSSGRCLGSGLRGYLALLAQRRLEGVRGGQNRQNRQKLKIRRKKIELVEWYWELFRMALGLVCSRIFCISVPAGALRHK